MTDIAAVGIKKKRVYKRPIVKKNDYLWVGTDTKGNKLNGEISGVSIAIVKAQLRKQGVKPLKVKKKPRPLFGLGQKIKPEHIAAFTRQMATMMQAGVPLIQSFDIIIGGSENANVKKLMIKIKVEVEEGSSLSQALRKFPKYFDALFCNLVEAGEKSGTLEAMLDRIATYKEKTESLKKKIKKALFYPAAVMITAIIVTAILLIFVVPTFQEMFENFSAKLPAFTQIVITFSEYIQAYWWVILAACITSGFIFSCAKSRSKKFAYAIDKYIVKLPVVGFILEKAYIARFSRTLSTTFAAGMPLVDALVAVAGTSGNQAYEQHILSVRDTVSSGVQLQMAMKQTGIFPVMVVQMVAIGEESGALDSMLAKVADIYEEEVDLAIDSLSSLLEPIIMAVLGVLVGGLVIAMYLPIFEMGSVV